MEYEDANLRDEEYTNDSVSVMHPWGQLAPLWGIKLPDSLVVYITIFPDGSLCQALFLSPIHLLYTHLRLSLANSSCLAGTIRPSPNVEKRFASPLLSFFCFFSSHFLKRKSGEETIREATYLGGIFSGSLSSW